jgi:NitT/TauT family transport system substrate-binding protein
VEGLAQYDPQVVFQSDWSRGGDAIVVNRNIKKVSDLRGKKIAVAPMTPSHSFLIWLLEAGDMTTQDVKIVEVPSAIDAADAFKSNQVDAAVVWSPDDQDCVSKVAGSKILESTKNASHIIADVFIAKKEFIEKNKQQVRDLYEGWMKGAAEINSSDAKKQEAAKILADGLNMPQDYCYNAINNVRLTTHGDNIDFFGLNPDYKGVNGEELYNKMKLKYDQLGYKTANAKSWRLLAAKELINTVNLTTPGSESEKGKVFTSANTEVKEKEALSTKQLSISFRSGEYQLDENAKQLIDVQFIPIAKAFSNSRVRIEGNTDNVGSFAANVALSKKRAQAVADYLIREHQMSSNRVIINGNGPSKPVAGCEDNATEACKGKNRRTDFELVND